jgi:hypothetical protein
MILECENAMSLRLELADNCVCQPQAFGDAFGVEFAHDLVRKRRCRTSSAACARRVSPDSLCASRSDGTRGCRSGC